MHADGIGVNVFDSNDPGQRWQINWTAELQVQHSALGLQVASCPRIPWRHAAPRTATAHRHSSPTPTHPHTHTPTQHPHPHPHPHTARSTQHTAHRTRTHRTAPCHPTARHCLLCVLSAVCCVGVGVGVCCVGVVRAVWVCCVALSSLCPYSRMLIGACTSDVHAPDFKKTKLQDQVGYTVEAGVHADDRSKNGLAGEVRVDWDMGTQAKAARASSFKQKSTRALLEVVLPWA